MTKLTPKRKDFLKNELLYGAGAGFLASVLTAKVADAISRKALPADTVLGVSIAPVPRLLTIGLAGYACYELHKRNKYPKNPISMPIGLALGALVVLPSILAKDDDAIQENKARLEQQNAQKIVEYKQELAKSSYDLTLTAAESTTNNI
jgi:hypothetical protein